MSLRLRRLKADAETLRRCLAGNGPIIIRETEGEPPDRYRLEYLVPGLVVRDGAVTDWNRHLVEIFLTLAYPRQAPQCRMLSPVFHPNIAPHAICIGDNWSAGESLPALVVRIAEMLCYQSYNIKSPLNGDAARWAEENAARLPLDDRDYGRLLAAGGARGTRPGKAVEVDAAPETPGPLRIDIPPSGRPIDSEGGSTPGPAAPESANWNSATKTPVSRADSCPSCGCSFSVSGAVAGSWVRCPMCGRMIRL